MTVWCEGAKQWESGYTFTIKSKAIYVLLVYN